MQITSPSNERLTKYARLLIELGTNVQENQILIIEAPVDAYPLVQVCCVEAFKRKAKDVIVFYTDADVDKERCLHIDPKEIKEVKDWQKESRLYYLKQGACSLLIKSAYPYLFKEVSNTASSALQSFTNELRNHIRSYIAKDNITWCIASYPNLLWATTLFPNDLPEVALNKMFDVVYEICHIRLNEDPIDNWKKHLNNLAVYGKSLDALKLDRLHFENSNGTDLTIGLHPNARFSRGNEPFRFVANIPTEEISTSPDKFRVDGIVYATKPLELGGTIIEDFGFEFKAGKIVRIISNQNRALLEDLVATDEGASFLGEVAFVQEKSPIAQSGLLFFNTLYDENAACHLAIGRGFPSCIEGCSNTDLNDWDYYHLNHSQIHIDFMFGSKDLKVTGYDKENKRYPIFIDGNFVLSV